MVLQWSLADSGALLKYNFFALLLHRQVRKMTLLKIAGKKWIDVQYVCVS